MGLGAFVAALLNNRHKRLPQRGLKKNYCRRNWKTTGINLQAFQPNLILFLSDFRIRPFIDFSLRLHRNWWAFHSSMKIKRNRSFYRPGKNPSLYFCPLGTHYAFFTTQRQSQIFLYLLSVYSTNWNNEGKMLRKPRKFGNMVLICALSLMLAGCSCFDAKRRRKMPWVSRSTDGPSVHMTTHA